MEIFIMRLLLFPYSFITSRCMYFTKAKKLKETFNFNKKEIVLKIAAQTLN